MSSAGKGRGRVREEILTKKVGIRQEENNEECRIGIGTGGLDAAAFPVYPFVAAAAVLQYPRKKLLLIVALGRFGRFFAEGLLAVLIGKRILRWAQSPAMYYAVLGILVLSLIGTGFSLYSWFKHPTPARLANN
ncbi:MAG TPA: hypothetical protein VHP35_15285 [Terriglobia bacterium]|jgi:hypothetical protein|nr:hypothetical protein [Terriglobia bacterium]